MNNNTVIIHITIHATIWRSTSPAWIVCAQTRTASEGYWACQWCGLSAGDQRQFGQRRWVQIGDDDIGKPDSNQSGVPVVHATQYRRCNQPLTNWRLCSFAYGALQIRLLLLLLFCVEMSWKFRSWGISASCRECIRWRNGDWLKCIKYSTKRKGSSSKIVWHHTLLTPRSTKMAFPRRTYLSFSKS